MGENNPETQAEEVKKPEKKKYIPGTPEEEAKKNKCYVLQDGFSILTEDIFKRLEELRNAEADIEDYEKRTSRSKIFNRFSGEYFSPTFVKSFSNCPAQSFINSCIPRTSSEIMNFGSCTHKVFERIVKEKLWGDEAKCKAIAEEELINFEIKQPNNMALLRERYLPNFLNAKDYLDPSKPFDYDKIQMFPEQFFKADLSIFDVPLGSCFNLMDRLDIREEGIFVIDYKTGVPPFNQEKKAEFIDSYLHQMICYAWMIEKQYGVKARVFAFIPHDGSYIEFPVQSLKNQSIFVEKIVEYYKDIRQQRDHFYFEERPNNYCKYCYIKDICNKKNNQNNSIKVPLDLNNI